MSAGSAYAPAVNRLIRSFAAIVCCDPTRGVNRCGGSDCVARISTSIFAAFFARPEVAWSAFDAYRVPAIVLA